MDKICLYSTATRKKEEFKPIIQKTVGIYSCGPTVYSEQHIGNMYTYLFSDILVKTLRYLGYEVKHVMNLTDVGHLTSDADTGIDKMEKGAKREGISVWDLAKKYEKQFFDSEKLLNINRPNVVCAATDHIKEQIELIKIIEKNGFTYINSDGIYFDTSKFTDYAKFANLNLKEIKGTDGDNLSKEKRSLSDFALWKFSPKNERRQMEWKSPWGVGFPGWHIECTAMSVKYLGDHFDIHTGGLDHIPVHHTNEIAQGFGAFGHQTANYWIHSAWVLGKNGIKMSKSLGNIFTMQDLVKRGIDPLAYRYLFLTTHYRKGLEFTLDNLENVAETYKKLRKAVSSLPNGGNINNDYKKKYKELLSSDLAMPKVIALVWKLIKDKDIKPEDKKTTVLDWDNVLGLSLNKRYAEDVFPEKVIKLCEERSQAKKVKKWAEADRLRNLIEKEGYIVEDDKNNGYKLREI